MTWKVQGQRYRELKQPRCRWRDLILSRLDTGAKRRDTEGSERKGVDIMELNERIW
jgi:hypothetical protein